LYYPQYGFNVLVTLDCRASWYSPVAIEYRTVSSAPPPTIDFEAARQTYCH